MEVRVRVEPPLYDRSMLIHSVYFWFKADADAALVRSFPEGLGRLCAIPDVQAAQFGKPASTSKRAVIDDSYAWALIATFTDAEAHDRYQAHPVHETFVSEFAATWQRVQVYDVHI
jgi:Stress responsive A/B Barrel Domain